MTEFHAGQFDIAVIGAGHAGIEAALAGARLGWGMGQESLMQDLNTICSSLDVHQVLWAQRGFRVGNRSYMKALNPFMRKGS